ncbi:MAG: helix-turn-helix domain-containing protein [Nitrososphaera sp.]|jgi:ArsR family transcriptional regulator
MIRLERDQLESDVILDILGNDTRRRILSVLAREPMYFNQLAREIDIGQQAILRHLEALEESGLVETYAEKSDLGAPNRKYYRLNSSFVLTIALSEDDFTISSQKIQEIRHKESMKKYYKKLDSIPEDTGRALAYLQQSMAAIDEEIALFESRLADLRALRQQILHRLHEIGADNFEGEERKVLYTIVKESPKSLAELSDILDEKESDLREIITSMKSRMKDSGIHRLLQDLD